MKKHDNGAIIVNLAVYILVYVLAAALGRTGEYLFSGSALLLLAAGEYLYYYKKHRSLLHMEAVFSLFWTGGVGLSAMKLSRLAQEWEILSWICFCGVYVAFICGYEWIGPGIRWPEKWKLRKWTERKKPDDQVMARRLLVSIFAVLLVSVACFLLEAAFKEIPLFSDKPHAYSEFHLSGVHYFTVSSIFVLPLSVLYRKMKGKLSRREWVVLGICCAAALAIPILCVSRFQLMMAVLLSVCVVMAVWPDIRLRYIILAVVVLIPVYVGLTVARNHDVSYLNGIFEMKNENTPIFITQPYMYVANNYDNVNCLVKELPAHTFGLRQLFPVFALTGLKFLAPGLVNFPIYVTKEELTTVTLIYDAYYDFGVVGVLLFGLILGTACRKLSDMQKRSGNPVSCLLYAQIAMYLVFSFFTTWFSNPTTWFWLALTVIIYIYVGYRQKE